MQVDMSKVLTDMEEYRKRFKAKYKSMYGISFGFDSHLVMLIVRLRLPHRFIVRKYENRIRHVKSLIE